MLNVAIAGFGFMGMTHAGSIIRNPSVHLCAIADKNTDRIEEKLSSRSGNFSAGTVTPDDLSQVSFYSDLAVALDEKRPDACIIAVHTDLHYELARLALESGAHVFLEKPFCLNVDEGRQLIELARAKNRILMIGHVVRFMPAYQTLKNWIDSGELGNLEFLSLSRFSGIPSWGQWKEKQAAFGSTGGALFDLVIHDIDFAQWACGIPEKINAQYLPGKLSNHDYISAFWKYNKSNLHVKIEGGNTFHPDYPFLASFTARFEHASVFYSSKDSENITLVTDTGIKLIPAGNANDGFPGELAYFFNCIKKGKQPLLCTPESALETIRICYRHISDIQD